MNFWCKILKCRLQLYRFILKYYKILGLAPFDIHVTPSTQTDKPSQQFDINYTYSFEEAAYDFILSLCLFFKIIYNFLHQQTEQSYWHDYHLINNFNLMIIYFNYCFNQRLIAKIITNLTSLESELTEKSWDYSLKITCVKNYCVCLTTFFNINFIVIIISNIIFNTDNTVDLYFTISTLFLTGTFVFQYAFIMIHLYQRFKILNHSLLSLVNNQSSLDFIFGTNCFRNEVTTRKLLFLRQAHRLLYEVNCDVTKFYSVPIFFAVLSFSPILVYSIRVLIAIEINNDIFVTINSYFDTSLWIIFSLLPIFTLTFFVTKVITEVCTFFFLIN